MKKLLLTVSLMIAAVTAFGQGQVIFANNGATRISNSVANAFAPAGTVVGLYGTVGNGALEGSLTLLTTTNNFAAGLYQGGTRTTSLPGGAATLQVRAWSAGYSDYESAFAAGLAGNSSVVVGKSGLMNVTLTLAPTPPPALTASGLTAFTVSPVPEPSSIALGLLGLGAVALFRRRK